MDTPENQSCRKRNGKETSFEFKLSVIAEIANGQISANFASKKYHISGSTISYWQKKLSNYIVEKKYKSKEDEIKALKAMIYDLEGIKDFQQDIIIEFERVTGKELSKKFLPEKLANEIQRKKKKLKD